MLSLNDLNTIERFFGQSSKGTWEYAQFASTTIDEHIALITDMLTKTAGDDLFGVIVPQPGKAAEDEPWIIALTGNGPTSSENAQFVTMAHEILPRLIHELRMYQRMVPVLKQVYRLRKSLPDVQLRDAIYHAIIEAMGELEFVEWLEQENV